MPQDLKRFAQAPSRSSEMPPLPWARITAGLLPSRSSGPPAFGSESLPLTTTGGPLRYARVISGAGEAGGEGGDSTLSGAPAASGGGSSAWGGGGGGHTGAAGARAPVCGAPLSPHLFRPYSAPCRV